MKRFFIFMVMLCAVLSVSLMPTVSAMAQTPKPQNKPYIDLRPLHFGILVGIHMQDIEMTNIGPQVVSVPNPDGTMGEQTQTILCDADRWNPGFSVGVLADLRLNNHLSLRFTPTMHFGAKHLTFTNLDDLDDAGKPKRVTQDMKNTYISFPVDLKFAAPRFNNYRPYIMAGVNPMLNLTGKDQDYVKLKPFDLMLEVGLGCDFYLPFFKIIPELKFCYGLTDAIDTDHANSLEDEKMRPYSRSVTGGRTKMIVLTLYFE